MQIQTQILDAILDGVSENVDSDELVRSVEWAAVDDTARAMFHGRFPDWDEYLAVSEVA